jgi:monothiol bacilliredoxin
MELTFNQGFNRMTTNLKHLETIEELNEALAESSKGPVLLFKHSLTCPISSRAYREFKSHLEEPDSRVSYNLIIVQEARRVSDEVAKKLGIRHESPQALLVRNGRSVWDASHYDITAEGLSRAIEQAKD